MKIRKLYDPYKQQTFANVEDLLAMFKDAKEHPENYDEKTITRLAEEVMGKQQMERPF